MDFILNVVEERHNLKYDLKKLVVTNVRSGLSEKEPEAEALLRGSLPLLKERGTMVSTMGMAEGWKRWPLSLPPSTSLAQQVA